MTPNDLRTKLTERRDSLEVQQGFLQARIDELDLVLGSLNEVPREPAPALPIAAPPEASAEKQPRERCADEIEGCFSAMTPLPENIDELPVMIRDSFTPRTLRSALNIAHARRQKSRAVLPPAEDASNRKDKVSASRPDDPQGDAGDNLDMPGFLKRTKEAAE